MMPLANSLRWLCCTVREPELDRLTKAKELDCARPARPGPPTTPAIDLSSSQLLLHLQCSAHTEGSWLSRICTILSSVKLVLRATDARLIVYGGDSLAAWVLAEAGGCILADGWGRLCGQVLVDQLDSVAIIRDNRQQQPQTQQQQQQQQQQPFGSGPGPSRSGPGRWPYGNRPDLNTIVRHPTDQPLRLAPADLLLLPVRQGVRLVAALVLGFGKDGAATGGVAGGSGTRVLDWGRQPSGGGGGVSPAGDLHLEPANLSDLLQLARILVLGVMGAEPSHARFMSKAADHLGLLPLCPNLSGLMGGVLQAVQELLALRFAIQLLPVLALTHGGSAGSRAVLFTLRGAAGGAAAAGAWSGLRGGGGGAGGGTGDSLLETYASVNSLLAQPVSSAGLRSVMPYRTASGLSVNIDRANSGTEGALAGVKAVRIALANTLLSEALRARSGLSAAGGDGGGSSPQGNQPQQRPSQSQPQPPPQQQLQPHFSSMILRDAGGFVLEEQQPCRDILTLGKLLGGGVGSLALCLEARPATATAAAAAAGKRGGGDASVHGSRGPVGGSGCGGCGGSGLTSTQGRSLGSAHIRSGSQLPGSDGGGGCGGEGTPSTAAAELHEAADAQLLASPVFALYLVSVDTLPYSMLEAVVQECKLLLGLLLGSVRASVAAGGRVAAELRALQQQLLDPAAAAGGGGGGVSVAAPSSPGPDGTTALAGGPVLTAATDKAVKRLISGHTPSRAKPRDCTAAAEARPGSAHFPGLTRMGSAATDGRFTAAGAQLLMTGADMLDRELGSPREGAPQRWMLASSPELALALEAAPGPSQLEVLVSTMRSHLGSAIAEAETAHEARSAVAQDMAALDLQEMIGRGGQGVVFKGLLHGLETAIKLNVCRDGEPLGEDELIYNADKPAPVYDTDGILTTVDWEEQGARLRKVKRGAMEHAIMPTLSHPNIVQVYATFSNVVTIKCTHKGERQPRLRLCSRDDVLLSNVPNQGPLNQVICFEYCDCGTLQDAAHGGAFRPPGASTFTAIARPALVPLYMSLLEVALALRYLHSRRLVHCDLKPANVLLKGSNRDLRGWTCKLSDFGCTRLMTELLLPPPEGSAGACDHHNRHNNLNLCNHHQSQADPAAPSPPSPPSPVRGFTMAVPLGTVAYMAPELFIKGQILTTGVDVYAFGILMYELLMCRTPYADMQPADVPRNVVRCHLRPEFHPLAPTEYCSLASRCWAASPGRRPTAADLVSEIEKLLRIARRSEEKRQEQASCTVRQSARLAASTAAPRPSASAAAAGAASKAAAPPAPPPPPPSYLRPEPAGAQRRPPGGRLAARFDDHPIAAARDDFVTSQTHSVGGEA